MPIIKSAKKRVRVAKRAAVRNSKTKRGLKSAIKAFQTSLAGSNQKKVQESFNKAQSELAKAGKKKVFHRNKVARKQSRLAQAAKKAAKAKPTKAATKSTAKKPTAKKTTTKK